MPQNPAETVQNRPAKKKNGKLGLVIVDEVEDPITQISIDELNEKGNEDELEVGEEFIEKIEDFRYENRVPSRSEAIPKLVEAGRHPNIEVVVAPAKVQGDGAAGEIADAVQALDGSGRVDVVIVARGQKPVE